MNIRRWWVNQFGGCYRDGDTLVWVIRGESPLARHWEWVKHKAGYCHSGCDYCYAWAMEQMKDKPFVWAPENDTGPTDPHRRTIWLQARQGGKTKQ